MSYSNGGGGTLTLPSPTHVRHVDVTSAVRSLRRSLSRSPSKFRLVTKSPSSSPKSPLSPSPLSPPKRISSHNSIFSNSPSNPPHTPSPLAVPFPPSVKLALRSSTRSKAAAPRPASRTRTSPKSPVKRALSHASDSGNATPRSSAGSAGGQENNSSKASPAELKGLDRVARMSYSHDISAPINQALSRLGGDGANDSPMGSSTSSPLKRSDAIMNLDQASLGSPVAKRRSLHGSASFGHDFNVFDHGPAPSSSQFDIHDDSNHEYELSTASVTHENPSAVTSMPRRSSSLRKSTLQQRHGEKTSWGRRQAALALAAQQLANCGPQISTPVKAKDRPRLSLDQFMPPLARDSPFSSQGSLPNASNHFIHQGIHQPHPLSRTMTTSSSSSSVPDDSPTHVPVQFGERLRPKLDFSKSLPAGSLRPFSFDKQSGDDTSFATPQNYKSVKPHAAAFASTGLISKVNRNPEQLPVVRGSSKGNVPDTPCKKHVSGFSTYPAPVPGSAIAKARHIRHSFGTPSTPFNPHGNQAVQGVFGKPSGVFGSTFGNRRGSFLSLDGDENGGSPDAKGGRVNDFDLPPTPTKQALAQQHYSGSPSANRNYAASTSAVGYGLGKKLTRTSSKLNLFTSPDSQGSYESDGSIDVGGSPTPAASHRDPLKSSDSVPSFSRSRTQRALNQRSPAPMIPKALTTTSLISPASRLGFAKFGHVAPASPLERIDFMERISPRTPQDSILPPDPSGLSISNPRDSQASQQAAQSMLPPATPTTGRDYFPRFSDRRLSTTPVSTFAPSDIDNALLARFEKVEMIGSGEFSRVYRVVQSATRPASAPSFSYSQPGSPLSRKSPSTPMPERVFAVKKTKQPYLGTRDRQRKLQEVTVLKALGHSDHVLNFVDSWEETSHLYIQTEYCEEGSLDLFLSEVGRRGRLDDFRIWKILLELGKGIKHVHDSGFIHLDLKPANIFITFAGDLKIGDFGMAASWPAQAGIEGEGDREYIGPEILMGQYDKPSDIFALGLIILEIAGNVQLPDNGPTWARLRSGDMSDAPSLTWSTDSNLPRDATGTPMEDSDMISEPYMSDDEIETGFGSPIMVSRSKRGFGKHSGRSMSHDPGNLFGSIRGGELHSAPLFMRDQHHEHALDKLVRWMISPTPADRPVINELLSHGGLTWVAQRRRAGATVFEGNWGPADAVLADDAEMIDV
ncbi:protein kinase [Drepanopeziza brunnea f. sp. 'multigermtubi' MB_m1]|uniref:Protein kinase n=1 Tax=Marssonina brunnea f. sp. multigermtubi (strain MB_m1) TaxID=1072389 RepID=K1W974_MARBU|nr:protein kinase [Drepanopeziza brunnea f. sp. 'multigermtubi' MB_m1]EKD13790.1 protein kinase [Drepanopeziza brunnea f. sp. 'multigermtubi' MB_m1]